jgi:hypothetical protein
MTPATPGYIKHDDGERISVVVFIPGREPLVATDAHPNFRRIVDAVDNDQVYLLTVEDFDVEAAIRKALTPLSGRVSVAYGQVYFDGEKVNGSIEDLILRFLDQGSPEWKPLVAFMENIASNPIEHSREQLFDWLNARDFSILPTGEIVAYKGVEFTHFLDLKPDEQALRSIHEGTAFVDGVKHKGRIPNTVGAVVTMPRDEVAHDPSVSCHTGLHVGTYDYASRWARGAMLQVAVNPADVVSVPTDASGEKVRVCRYRVLDVIDKRPADEPPAVIDEPTPGRVRTWLDRITGIGR